MRNIKRSLKDILGDKYIEAAAKTAEALHDMPFHDALEIAERKVDFYSSDFSEKQKKLACIIGEKITDEFANDNTGAPTESFAQASKISASPIGGIGAYRVGEDGRLYLASKSEHYHTPLGHNFPGFKLIDHARRLGIMNATHNNTRGYITRLLERELVRTLNGIKKGDDGKLGEILVSKEPKVLNRVINLETGSLAVEAGIKMMLTRFYKLDKTYESAEYDEKTPVFLVVADNEGGFEANYHGTTTIAQTFRGMWPDMYRKSEEAGIYKVVSVNINDIADFEEKIKKYNCGDYKTAGFLHEIILMNYGGIRLEKDFLAKAHELCEKYDTPVLIDEIQSCMWYEGMYLYKLYGLKPDFVILGKGFSGGEYPASKVVTTYEMDSLSQFGALVTNGQEELASLAYLITMEFAQENGDIITERGEYFTGLLNGLKEKYSGLVEKIEGMGHLAAIHFGTVEEAYSFSKTLNEMCIDISAQVYKANCPPGALLKPPFIMEKEVMDYLAVKMEEVLSGLQKEIN